MSEPLQASPVRPPPPRSAARPAGRRPARGHVLAQVLVVVAGLGVYSAIRGLGGTDAASAVDHAHDLIAVERALGIYWEPQLQQLALRQDVVLDVLNSVYIWAHWPLLAGVLVWLVRRHPPQYLVLRDALVVSCVIALVVYALYPVAPPRLSGLGLLDSVTTRSHAYRVLQPPGFTNQYAAVPSMHMGWDLLIAIMLVRHAGSRAVRAVGWVLPPLMLAAIVLTANHWLLDAVAGIAVALVGLHAAHLLDRRRTARAARPVVHVPLPRAAAPGS